MTIILRGSACPFNRTISDRLIKHAIQSESQEKATDIGVWEKIKDWFCGTDSKEALKKIYELTHDHSGGETTRTESVLNRVLAFYQLKHMAYPAYQDRFKASISETPEGCHIFSFSIESGLGAHPEDVLIERNLAYGNTEEEISFINLRVPTNASETLNKDTVKAKGIEAALDQVKYIPRSEKSEGVDEKFEGVSEENQKRINSHLLKLETKQNFAEHAALAGNWIRSQLRVFDHYSELRALLDSAEFLNITSTPGTDDSWVYDFAMSLDAIKKQTTQAIAESYNNSYSVTPRSFAQKFIIADHKARLTQQLALERGRRLLGAVAA